MPLDDDARVVRIQQARFERGRTDAQNGEPPTEASLEYQKGYMEAAQVEERPSKPDQIRVDRGDYIRAGGDVICEICGCVYYDHPSVRGFRWLHRACDGKLLKL